MGTMKVAELSRIRINKLLCLNLCMELKYLPIGLPLLIALIFAEAKHDLLGAENASPGLSWLRFLAAWKPAHAAESCSVRNQNRVC